MGVQLSLPGVKVPPAPLYLVACAAQKRREPSEAADLYLSQWFRKARRYVEARGGDWCILSARHGLLEPSDVIGPYNQTLNRMTARERAAWGQRVVAALRLRAPAPRPLVILAGEHYRAAILAEWGERCSVPMQGLGIGEQLSWLKRNAAP